MSKKWRDLTDEERGHVYLGIFILVMTAFFILSVAGCTVAIWSLAL